MELKEFVVEQEDWVQCAERLSQYLLANDFEDKEGKKDALLLSVCGAKPYSLIRSLVAPEKPSAKNHLGTGCHCLQA